MAKTITLEVARYRPEQEAEPTFESFDVPLNEDWVVLDALNYVKDRLDGSLSYRWSCRMGVCGSCGMMVNGDPKLTCATFLTAYDPGPIRVEPLRYFPIVRDLVVEITDFMNKLKAVKPWIVREEEKPLAEGEYLQTPEQLESYKQFSMCINCLCCYAACPVVGLDQHRATRAPKSAWTSFRNTKASGVARSTANARGSVRRTSTRRAPSSSTRSRR